MDMFRSEKTQIDKRLPEVHPKLEDLGQRGKIIAEKLHEIKNAVKYPRVKGHVFFGSEKSKDEVEVEAKNTKCELDVYGEKASILVGDLTVILTQIRH